MASGAKLGRVRPWVVALLVLPLAGCLGEGDLILALSAPDAADGMTIFAAREDGLGDTPSRQARYRVEYDGRTVYPPGGVGGIFIVSGGSGSQFLPYNFFVEGNGRYDVVVELDDETAQASARVEKWVEYVYLHPYWKNGKAIVDVQLSKASGGSPEDRVIARGDLVLEVRYRGLEGSLNTYSGVLRAETPDDATFTRIDVPRSTFSKGPGYYSFESTFHNGQAKGNTGVHNDPSMAARSPPWNWIKVDGP